MRESDPVFEMATADFLFNQSKFRRTKFEEGDVVKEIIEYYYKHNRESTEAVIENILFIFKNKLEANKVK
jgi:hypothetical protein